MAEAKDDWKQFWVDLINGLEDGRKVLQVVLVVIGAGSGLLALYLHFLEKQEKEKLNV